ncbi:C39 family peptidase [Bradyrhizobium sediminis]|uniref:C39 family peptidase n=1 Tax=Bradyrhizobium sediminis TaxID=2840469 RepID=A0A975RNU7_9BRAD|nr:C39 family peptidase [Bradyrhizobium sediminis]QWG14174.1 C39 family peptidase [Bradyrhizobium sediminis]
MADGASIGSDVQLELLDFLFRSFSADIGLMSGLDLEGSRISKDLPLPIADLNSSPLFLDYAVINASGKKIGVVRSSARGTEFPLIDSIMIGRTLFEQAEAERQVLAQAAKDYPGAKLSTAGFVCYGYPRIGIVVLVADGSQQRRAIYDAHMTSYRVRELAGTKIGEAGARGGDLPEGEPFYSFIDRLPEAGPSPVIGQQWNSAMRYVATVRAFQSGRSAAPAAVELLSTKQAERLIRESMAASLAAPAPPRPAISGTVLPILRLIGQETPVFCAVATAAMILEYIGYTGFTQQDIAKVFKTGEYGTYNADMISGFETLTNGGWRAAVDTAPTVDKARDYLGSMIPGKTGILGHARLLRGWREYSYVEPRSGHIMFRDSYYLVNDPYPIGSGQLVMESLMKPIGDFYRNLLSLSPTAP